MQINKISKPLLIGLAIAVFLGINWSIYHFFYLDRNAGTASKEINLLHNALGPAQQPVPLGEISLKDENDPQDRPKPAWVYIEADKLYVNYYQQDKVDVLTPKGRKLRSFQVKIGNQPGFPQGMAKLADRMMIADYQNSGVGLYNNNGKLLDAYFETPDKEKILPVGVAVYNAVFYITNVNTKGWMAVGDDGEVITIVKGSDKQKLEMPYGIVVTDDGRVVISDPVGGALKVFACVGWYAFDIDTKKVGLKHPQGIAIDGYNRIHVVDNGTGKIFVFDNLGKYLFQYGEGLQNPSTIAIDKKNRVIYVTNTEKGSLSVWGY